MWIALKDLHLPVEIHRVIELKIITQLLIICNAAPCHPSPTPLILNILAVFFIKHFVQSRTRLEEAAPHGYGWAAPLAADFFRPCVVKSRRKRGGLVL